MKFKEFFKMENVSSLKRKLSTETLNELKKTTEFNFY